MEMLGFWAAAVIAAVLVGMAKGGIPVIGMLSVPVLSLVISPVTAAGLLLPVYIVSDMFGLWAYRRSYDRRVLAIIVPAAMVGIFIGWLLVRIVPEQALALVIGTVGAAFALNLMLRRPAGGPPRQPQLAPGLFWGAATGFTSFVSHSGAPPYQIYVLPLRLEKAAYAGTATIAFAFINAAKLIPYWQLGQVNLENLQTALILAIPASAAVFLGVWLVKVMPTHVFFRFIVWSLLLVSLKLIWDGVHGLGWI